MHIEIKINIYLTDIVVVDVVVENDAFPVDSRTYYKEDVSKPCVVFLDVIIGFCLTYFYIEQHKSYNCGNQEQENTNS